jgi:uncharacterized protein
LTRILYLDSSAITKLVIEEPESAAVRAAVADRQLVTSRVAVVEVTRAVAREDPGADCQPVLEALAFIELDEALARSAASLGGPDLRSLDAINVASAMLLEDDLDAFLTYDRRQAIAAASAGMTVLSPGVDATTA